MHFIYASIIGMLLIVSGIVGVVYLEQCLQCNSKVNDDPDLPGAPNVACYNI